MDIQQLKTIIHVEELGSLSKAAERLNLAQPALSRQIRLLEEELGVRLFERHGRGMVITAVGQAMLSHAASIMREMDAIRATAAAAKTTISGTVEVGMTPTVSEFVIAPLMEQTKARHPNLGLRFSSAFSGHLMDWLKRGELDVAFSYDLEYQPSLIIKPVMVENLLLIGPADAKLHLEQPVPFSALQTMPLVLPSPRHGLRRIVDECARKAGVKLASTVEVDSFGAMVALVKSGFGATILPLPPVYDYFSRGVVTAAPIIDPVPSRKLVVAFASDGRINAAARYIGDSFVEIARDLVNRGVWSGYMTDEPLPLTPI